MDKIKGRLMKYYVVADVHGFFNELMQSLTEKGFFVDNSPRKLIVCGDLFDRGGQAVELQSFVQDLIDKDEVILIRGNHEDLFDEMLNGWHKQSYFSTHNAKNGTLDTVLQLTGRTFEQLELNPCEVYSQIKQTPFYQNILPRMLDYYETDNHVFVHGWIPCCALTSGYGAQTFSATDWRSAGETEWRSARWLNGMKVASQGVTEPNKTIVCGHYHCSYGHKFFEGKGSEFDADADFSPFFGKGIIAIDACTVLSHKVNCLVLED